MHTIDFLINRRSTPVVCLEDPAPQGEDLQMLLKAAVTVPDHGALRPWRFLLITGDARVRLGDIFAEATQRANPEANIVMLDTIRQKPLRAPLIIAVIAKIQPNHKIPVREQFFSAGAVAYNLVLAAEAIGFGAVWLTGVFATDPYVYHALELKEHEEITGFIHIGTPNALAARAREKALARPNPADITSLLD